MKIICPILLALAVSGCIIEPVSPGGAKDVVLCHKGKKTMTLPQEAAAAHLKHGDRHGPC